MDRRTFPFGNADLQRLSVLNHLETLHLDGSQVDDDGLEHLTTLTHLRHLSLHNTQVTGKAVKKLRQALPNCSVYPLYHDTP
jgi:hypothetical protein